MLVSQFLITTTKETPADAELASHQLMTRAGLIKKLASGLYTWMPLGLRVLKKVEKIVREEMNAAGALECLMPAVQPGELWQESGRYDKYGPELLRFKDRHDRDFCLGPTHEEVMADIARRELKSYKQLPLNLYQIQIKFRDEIRPRFGLMRAREFLMKDAYSFDIDEDAMNVAYEKMYNAYVNIFTKLGLTFRPVLADSGAIGGSYSHEFQVLADAGEDVVVYSDGSDYAANLERAEAQAPEIKKNDSNNKMEKVETPGMKTIADLEEKMKWPANHGVKTMIVKGSESPLVAIVLRGDHELNELKVEKFAEVAEPFAFADEADIKKALGCGIGSLGPVDLNIPYIVDRDAAALVDFNCGANEDDFHFKNVAWGRDAQCDNIKDCRNVVEGDISPDGQGKLCFTRGVEVGHVFQFGTKYSKAMNATVLNENGKAVPLQMGSYGIGVSRVVAAAIEQNHDNKGIKWPLPMAPFSVVITPVQMHKSYRVRDTANKIYEELKNAGIEVLLDDRKERPGVMFADMDLIGIPHRLVIGERGLDNNEVEYKARDQDDAETWLLEEAVSKITALLC